MTERYFSPGEFVYQEGDKSDFAFFIRTGRVEILKSEQGVLRQVTILGPGDVFGEMGVVLDQRRSVTVRALEPVSVHAVSRFSFIEAVNQQPEMARSVLKSLLTRLHQDERPSAEVTPFAPPDRHEAPVEPRVEPRAPRQAANPVLAAEPDSGDRALERLRLDLRGVSHGRNRESDTMGVQKYGTIRILADSEEVGQQMETAGVEVERLPFRVGRDPEKSEERPEEDNDLAIDDQRPYNLSRHHFSVEQTRRGLVVRDCDSHLGTVVNGVRIGAGTNISVAILRIGDNTVIAGSDTSPYRFTIQVGTA